jgi:predicted metal-dependent HD superfamily phosphohydrolase
MLETSWKRCWEALVPKDDAHNLGEVSSAGEALMNTLIAAYNEPQRKYHTEQHLRECLTLFNEHIQLAQAPAEIEMALWFHDAIYDVNATGSKNEDQSAD